jgi:hypothetical protein
MMMMMVMMMTDDDDDDDGVSLGIKTLTHTWHFNLQSHVPINETILKGHNLGSL